MNEVTIEFCWLDEERSGNLPLPAYETDGAAGMDVAADILNPVVIQPHDIALIPTGFAVAIPAGYEIQVRPRSGLAVKFGVTIINSPGTIDSDYRGEVKIGLINLGKDTFTVNRGDRIAQLVVSPVLRAGFRRVEILGKTKRGAGGFGHTGV